MARTEIDNHSHKASLAFTQGYLGLDAPALQTTAVRHANLPVRRSFDSATFNQILVLHWGLKIANLDHTDPPDYRIGALARGDAFNKNVFFLTADCRMPSIQVQCDATGFDPKQTPIYWRLVCRHVISRVYNSGHQTYHAKELELQDEWQGRSYAPDFTLFEQSCSETLHYDYNENSADNDPGGRIAGGHCMLMVAARPDGCEDWLIDFVHVRILGTEPGETAVKSYIDELLKDRDASIVNAVKAICGHENRWRQFLTGADSGAWYKPRFNSGPCGCDLHFQWPSDPAGYPSVAFDFGVGISQQTWGSSDKRSNGWWQRISWSWRENVRAGVNELFGKFHDIHPIPAAWKTWVEKAMIAYNGGSEYVNNMRRQGDEGRPFVSLIDADTRVTPSPADRAAQTKLVPAAPDRIADEPAPAWPPAPIYNDAPIRSSVSRYA